MAFVGTNIRLSKFGNTAVNIFILFYFLSCEGSIGL